MYINEFGSKDKPVIILLAPMMVSGLMSSKENYISNMVKRILIWGYQKRLSESICLM